MNNLDARYAHGDRLSETLNVSQPVSFGRNDYSTVCEIYHLITWNPFFKDL